MASLGLTDLQREYDRLTARGCVLLSDADAYLDGEMAAFIGTYLVALKQDFSEAVRTEREPMLQLIIGELKDLVLEIQGRIEQGKAVKEQALS